MNVYHHDIRMTADKIARRLKDIAGCIYREMLPLSDLHIGPGDSLDGADGWQPIHPGDQWGGRNVWNWFRATVIIPQSWAGQRVGLYFALGHPSWRAQPEALAYINGEFRQGIDGNHHEILLAERAQGGETYNVALRAWCTMFDEDTTALYQQVFWAGDLVQIDLPTRHFYHSVEVALDTARALDHSRYEYRLLMNALDDSVNQLDLRAPGSAEFYDSVARARTMLDERLAQSEGLPQKILATGHAHIDVLWRWREVNTREKTLHTFGNVLRLMEQYPDFHFTQSQPQLYQFVKQDAPALYEQIRVLVREGRWEPTGGMWIEADCNIPNGESLVRQLLLGRTFLRDEFGVDSPILWLPDTFGYSWALPQLIKRSGMHYFMTSKISWNQYNRLPYDSFWWRGLDGTEVLTHFLTAPGDPPFGGSTYNANLSPQELIGTWDQYQQKDRHEEVFTAFGWGDGGGGPTIEMLERAERARNHPGLPRLQQGSAKGFFDRLETDGDKLPTWNGELYLEYHRGTYTTQARSKRANRKAEVLYHRAELAAAIATLVGQPYPRERLNEGWRLILINQFHDVIPGSSIREVYVDSLLDYETVVQIGQSVINESIAAIASELPLAEGEHGILLVHAAGVSNQRVLAAIPAEYIPEDMAPVNFSGVRLAYQRSGDSVYVEYGDQKFEGAGWELLRLAPADSATIDLQLRAGPRELENENLRIEFNDLGEITRLYDKRWHREVITPGNVANQLEAFEDRPAKWDAWDIDITYADKMWTATPGEIKVIESGPLRATLEIHKLILGSPVVQRISLERNSYRIDFETRIDWHERHVLLKVAFPVNILSPRATFDVQFGNVERPTHHNTSWDWARFETVGHKWVNLSEGNYSVSLLNDCKYGHDVHDNVIRLSLLRAPTFPDPDADQGEQVFTYSLLIQDADWTHDTIPEAYLLNDPVMAFSVNGQGGKKFSEEETWFSIRAPKPERPFVIVDTVKGAEDGRGLIVRLYETKRSRGDVTLHVGLAVAQAIETNLMEEDERSLEVVNGKEITLHFTPFQIRTLRLIPA